MIGQWRESWSFFFTKKMFQKDRHQRWQPFSARRGCVNTSPPTIAQISNNFASMQGELHNELGIIFFLFSDRICRIHDPSDYLRESSIWRSVAATSTQTQVLSRRGIKPKRKNKSSDMFDDMMSLKVTKPFISSNAYTRNKWFSNSGNQKENSVLKPR